jgi:hypothetical protein
MGEKNKYGVGELVVDLEWREDARTTVAISGGRGKEGNAIIRTNSVRRRIWSPMLDDRECGLRGGGVR